jgi:hypothetical protein
MFFPAEEERTPLNVTDQEVPDGKPDSKKLTGTVPPVAHVSVTERL